MQAGSLCHIEPRTPNSKLGTRIQAGSLCYFGLMIGSMQVLSTYRFTVDEYHRLGEVGILDEDDRVELLDGDLITMAPIGGEHRTLVDSLTLLFATRAEKNRYRIGIQNPISLDSYSEPQPDV